MTKFELNPKSVAWLGIICWAVIVVAGPISYSMSNFFDDGEWWSAEIAIDPGKAKKPDLIYAREARKPLKGTWQSWVEIDGVSVCGGSGNGHYGPVNNGISTLSWSYFIGKDCPLPEKPFRICADWVMQDLKGEQKDFGPICSETHKP